MAANPEDFGWQAEDEHYADENFADPDQNDNSPLNASRLYGVTQRLHQRLRGRSQQTRPA
jgi:hypothetical protein